MTLHRSAAAARAPARSPGRKRRSGALSIEISIKLNRGLYCGRDSRAERARSRPATRLRHSPHTTASSTRPAARLGRSVDARTARVDALNQHCCGTTLCCTPYKRRSMRRAHRHLHAVPTVGHMRCTHCAVHTSPMRACWRPARCQSDSLAQSPLRSLLRCTALEPHRDRSCRHVPLPQIESCGQVDRNSPMHLHAEACRCQEKRDTPPN